MGKFEEIKIGNMAELTHKITENDVQIFSELTGDDNPLHMDAEYAKKTSFRKRVAHGMLTASFISTVIGTRLPGKGSLWISQNIKFLLPVRIDDTIRVTAYVKHKSIANRVVTLDLTIINQNKQKVIEGEAKVKMLKEKKEDENMMDDEKGAAIVTGASRGIGAATSLKLAKDGYKVVINYRANKEDAEKVLDRILGDGGEGCIFNADVRNYNEVEKMVQFAQEKYGKIDVLVNNATSKITNRDFEHTTWENVMGHIETQVKGALNTCKAVIPMMVSQKNGKIVNIGSVYADNVPPPKLHDYVIAKSALVALTRSLAVEYGPKGLNINCVSPGMTETTLIADVPDKVKMVTEMQTPMRRLSKPQDVANIISFLSSASANYLAGETIRVCGGQIML